MPLNLWKLSLFWAAGANRDYLEQCPRSEHVKYECIGALICLTAAAAGISMFLAISIILQETTFSGSQQYDWRKIAHFAGPIALLWATLIFFLDRYIVSSMRLSIKGWRFFLQAAPRLLLAFFIGLIISTPIEVKVFESEIKKVLNKRYFESIKYYNDKLDEEDARIRKGAMQKFGSQYETFVKEKESNESDLASLEVQISTLRADRDTKLKEALGEANGTRGTLKEGRGPVYRERMQEYREAERQLSDTLRRQQELIIERNTLKKKQDDFDQEIDQRRVDLSESSKAIREQQERMKKEFGEVGFLDRLIALMKVGEVSYFQSPARSSVGVTASAAESDKITEANTAAYQDDDADTVISRILWTITFFFILLESTPVLMKIIMGPGPYDEFLSMENDKAKMTALYDFGTHSRVSKSFLDGYEDASKFTHERMFNILKARVNSADETSDTLESIWSSLKNTVKSWLDRLNAYAKGGAPKPEFQEIPISPVLSAADALQRELRARPTINFEAFKTPVGILVMGTVVTILAAWGSIAILRIGPEQALPWATGITQGIFLPFAMACFNQRLQK